MDSAYKVYLFTAHLQSLEGFVSQGDSLSRCRMAVVAPCK